MTDPTLRADATKTLEDLRAGSAGFVRDRSSEFESRPAGARASWLDPLRRKAMERFVSLGLPTTRDEDWRFTSVAPIREGSFSLAQAPDSSARPSNARPLVDPASLEAASYGLERCHRFVFVDGHLIDSPAPSSLPRGVRAGSLARAAAGEDRSFIEAQIARHAAFGSATFTALNTAFLEDGAFLHVPEGEAIEDPFLFVFLSGASGAGALCHPRVLAVAGRGSRFRMVESYAPALPARSGGAYMVNAVTEIVLEEGAVVGHCRLQDDSAAAIHIASVQALVRSGAALSSHAVSLGAGLARSEVGALLDGEGTECTLDGLFVGTGTRHLDHRTVVDHARPRGTSRQTYKGILDDASRGVFDGKIIVRPDAQKTDARQVNRNLLLSDGALVDTKPQLEIRADDVKCAHAATIGRLDEASMFYLRSRGLDLGDARRLLIHAFAGEVISGIRPESLRPGVQKAVSRLLGGADETGEP